MSTNNSNKPKLRFKGFSDDWEQHKFSELYARSSEKNDGTIGMDKNITVATMQFKNDVKVSTTEYLKTYYTFKLGDIAFEGHQSKEFRYGRFVENDIGNGIVSHIFAVFRPIQEYDLYFWKYAINNETLMQRILARSTKASTMMHDLVTNDFLNETFLVPSVKEQKQIGAFLNKLDNLITLHQRKCDNLKIIKKSMLDYLFPKNGEKVPKWRFKGFNNDWEQRKLRDISSLITKGTTPLDKSGAGDVNFIKVENLDSNSGEVISGSKISIDEHEGYLKRSQLKAGDILFSIAGTLGRVGIIKSSILPANTNQALAIIRTKEGNVNYISTVLRGRAVTDFIHRNPTVGAQPNLSLEQVGDLKIPYPSLDEQKKIGDYFKRLDHLITLHQSEVERLKKAKQFFLDKMFI